MNKANILGNKKNNNFERDREKDKDKEIDMLKKNLLNGPVHVNREIFPVNISKDNNNINSNLNNLNNINGNNNYNNILNQQNFNNQKLQDEKKHNLIINPGHALNYENNRKNKPSLEIESNRTPKISELKIPESNRRQQEKRESVSNYNYPNSQPNNNNNINNNPNINAYPSHSSNDKKNGKKSNRDSSQSAGIGHVKKGSSVEAAHGNLNNINSKGDSEKEIIQVNHSGNLKDRRRSESRTSQDEKGEKSNIKDFIKNMRDNVIFYN